MIWTIFRKSQFRWALVGLLVVLVLVQLFWTQPSTDYWSNVSRLLPVDGLIVKPFSKEKVPIGKLHFLIAATQANKFFCRTLLSATVTRYGPPVIAGWRATGINDAGASHLAKIRVVLQYLDQLPKSADDDLFLAVDGYDVYMQFGADVLIERYYQLVQQEDGRVLQQLGPADADRIAGPLGRHVFFGYDKGCAPDRPTLVGCWAGSGPNHHTLMTFGPETDTGHPFFNHPRWLNSGTVMGPIREVRDIYRATLALIESTYDLTDPDRDHDQFYIGTLWGEQEYERILAQLKEDPSAPVHKGPDNAVIPALEPGRSYNKHIALDYDGQLFQPWAANEWWVEFRNFSGPQFSYRVEQNIDESPKFRPWQFHLPGESLASLHRIWSSTPKPDQALLGQTSNELVRSSRFGSSHVTRSVFGMWHCTLDKSALDKFWPQLWFNSLSQPLVRSAIAWFRDGPNPFTPKPINGRVWYPARTYPATISLDDGGAWSDTSSDDGTVSWLSWQDICHEFEADVIPSSPPT